MLSLTTATLRTQSRRYLAPGLAVVLGVAFITATLVLSATLTSSTLRALTGDLDRYAAVALPRDAALLPGAAEQTVRRLGEVADVHVVRSGRARLSVTRGGSFVVVSSPPSPTSAATVAEGRLPAGPGEVALSRTVASASGLRVGDRTRVSADARRSATATTARARPSQALVVGVVDASSDPRYGGGMPFVFAVPAQVAAWTGTTGLDELDVVGATGADPAAVRDAVAAALGGSATVQTGQERAHTLVEELTGSDFLATILLGFGGIALFVSALVIANTFTILLARRARETALLRCVGATRAQVLRLALAEAVVLGVLASSAGVVAGCGVARLLVAVATRSDLGLALDDFTVPASAVVVPVVLGAVVTAAATVLPVVRSARVVPLAALRPALALRARSRAGRFRIGAGLVLLCGGVGLLALASATAFLPIGLLGGAVSFLGVMLAGSVLVPLAARAVGALPARLAGVPGELALDNTVRHPARAAATTSALLIGVTLITMMSVGAATGEVAATREIDRQFPVDAVVAAEGSALATPTIHALTGLDGVAAGTPVPSVDATVGTARDQRVSGVPPQALGTLRSTEAVQRLRPGTVLVSAEAAEAQDLADGDTVTVRVGVRARVLSVVVTDAMGRPWTVTDADLRAVAPRPAVHEVWLRFADDAEVASVLDAVHATVAEVPDASVQGAAPLREQLARAVDITLAVVVALLALSVLIAVVGIGNTLSLSVLERTHESALLRALGLTRVQLRLMLAAEAALLAVVGVVLGSLLGIGYGWAGPKVVLGQVADVRLVVPWAQLGLVAAGAVAAGLLASVLPARRAARVSPAAALAGE